ncbi:MAG: hypothetical protein PVF26_04660 [Desulfobacterales bacterium]
MGVLNRVLSTRFYGFTRNVLGTAVPISFSDDSGKIQATRFAGGH